MASKAVAETAAKSFLILVMIYFPDCPPDWRLHLAIRVEARIGCDDGGLAHVQLFASVRLDGTRQGRSVILNRGAGGSAERVLRGTDPSDAKSGNLIRVMPA
jgi:hypothetical protein